MVLTEAAQVATRLKMPCTIERGNFGYVVLVWMGLRLQKEQENDFF